MRQLSTKQKIHRFYPKCAAVTSQRRPVQAAPEAPAARSSVAENLSQRKYVISVRSILAEIISFVAFFDFI